MQEYTFLIQVYSKKSSVLALQYFLLLAGLAGPRLCKIKRELSSDSDSNKGIKIKEMF